MLAVAFRFCSAPLYSLYRLNSKDEPHAEGVHPEVDEEDVDLLEERCLRFRCFLELRFLPR